MRSKSTSTFYRSTRLFAPVAALGAQRFVHGRKNRVPRCCYVGGAAGDLRATTRGGVNKYNPHENKNGISSARVVFRISGWLAI